MTDPKKFFTVDVDTLALPRGAQYLTQDSCGRVDAWCFSRPVIVAEAGMWSGYSPRAVHATAPENKRWRQAILEVGQDKALEDARQNRVAAGRETPVRFREPGDGPTVTLEETATAMPNCWRREIKGHWLAPVAPADAATDMLKAIEDPDHAYHELAHAMLGAYEQAAMGKGRERHANDLPFKRQRMQTIARGQGHMSGLVYQICKKAQESERMEPDARIRELQGAMVYCAGAIVFTNGQGEQS